ncbi:phage tail protein [Vibrio alginolyticus]|uniref:phage tail tube protein n=1 Tax=Vibrio alginolyticus TaxID=663 RepID=UPI001CD141FC|nr:phage tail tube protein [Vibrio alginolyticus]
MAATYGMIPVAGKGNSVWVLKKAATIEQAITAGEQDDVNWDKAGYVSGITPVNMTKEVNTETYLDSEDGYAKQSTGQNDAGDLSFSVGLCTRSARAKAFGRYLRRRQRRKRKELVSH